MGISLPNEKLVELPDYRFPIGLENLAKGLELTDEVFRDRTEVVGFTVDDASSPDLDDAIHLREMSDSWIVEITISDVDSLVKKDSDIDKAAAVRVATQYFGEKKGSIPMLPKVLSENRLSLHEAKLRPTITVRVTLNKVGQVLNIELAKTYLRSFSRMAHSDYQGSKIIGDPGLPMNTYLEFAKLLAARRLSKGSIAMQHLIPQYNIDEEGNIRQGSVSAACQIVQEFMILANTSVAEFLTEQKQPAPYRVHQALEAATTPTRSQIINEIEKTSDYLTLMDNLRFIYNKYLLGAVYQPTAGEHFGLGVDAYLHFTSPIRRYADLINHRIVKALIDDAEPPYSRADIERLCNYLNETLRRLQTLRAIKSGKHSLYNYRQSTAPHSTRGTDALSVDHDLEALVEFQNKNRVGGVTFEYHAKPGVNIVLTCTASARYQGKRYTFKVSERSDKMTVKNLAARGLRKKLERAIADSPPLADKPVSNSFGTAKTTVSGQLIDYCQQNQLNMPNFHWEIWGGGVTPTACHCRITRELALTGYGPNTKIAKTEAAGKMLEYLKTNSAYLGIADQ